MSAPVASACIVVLNQQCEQTIQRHEHCDQVTIAPCKTLSGNCTIVENGHVVVKPIQIKPAQPAADASPKS